MFIQTEATPNPATLKFLPGRVVLTESTFEAKDAEGAARSPLATALFAVPGVSGVYFGHDFISVTKAEGESDWPQVKPAVLGAIMEHFQSGAPVMAEGVVLEEGSAEEFYDEADHDTVVTIKDLLETRVRPAVASDGGDITFRGYKEGVVYLEMKGRLLGLPVLHRDAPPGRAEPVQALPAERARSPGDLTSFSGPRCWSSESRPPHQRRRAVAFP